MKAVSAQIKLLFKRKSFILTLTFMMLYSIMVFIINCIKSFNNNIIEVKAAKYLFLGSDFLNLPFILYSLIFPIIAVLPFADSYFEERKNKTTEFCLMRLSGSTYYFSKMITVFFSGFIVNFVPLLTNMLLNFIAFPIDSSIDATNFSYVNSHLFTTVMETGLFKDLFAGNMYLYNLLYLILASVSSGLIAVIVYQFSFFYNKSRILLNCSFFIIYSFINILFGTVGLDEFCLENYIFASRFYRDQSVRGVIVTFSLLILTAVIPTLFIKNRLRNIYD